MKTKITAEKDCVAKGGHLFHISDRREQDFILLFINSDKFPHACWTGLHDLITEEQFEWVSGETLIALMCVFLYTVHTGSYMSSHV